MGDLIVDLIKYEGDTNTADFLDKLYSISLICKNNISNKNNTSTEKVNN